MKISYLSDTNESYKRLEVGLESGEFGILHDIEMQRAFCTQEANALMQGKLNDLSKKYIIEDHVVAEIQEALLPADISLPTRFDSPVQYMLLENLVDMVENGAKRIGIKVSPAPKFSCIPTGLVNGAVVKLRGPECKFLVIDSQLLLFCHLFAKAFALCMPTKKTPKDKLTVAGRRKAISNHLNKNQKATAKIHEVLTAYCKDGNPSEASYYDTPKKILSLSGLIREGMELFVVAHEYGHLFAEHLDEDAVRKKAKKHTISEQDSKYLIEHEADELGFYIVTQVLGERVGSNMHFRSLGILLFFGALTLSERFEGYLLAGSDPGFRDEDGEEHPSTMKRLIHLGEVISAITEGEVQSTKLIGSLYWFLEEIWERVLRLELAKDNKA